MRTLVIGADGGGTKTALVAADAATGRAVARAVAGGLHAPSKERMQGWLETMKRYVPDSRLRGAD